METKYKLSFGLSTFLLAVSLWLTLGGILPTAAELLSQTEKSDVHPLGLYVLAITHLIILFSTALFSAMGGILAFMTSGKRFSAPIRVLSRVWTVLHATIFILSVAMFFIT